MTDTVQRIANSLDEAAKTGKAVEPVRVHLSDIAQAYAVQDFNTQRKQREGHRVTGRKVGLTSRAVQKQLKVDQPDFGTLFDTMAVSDGEEIAASRLMQAKCEAEVALVLKDDLDGEHIVITDLLAATTYALPAIEIVGSRIANWDINILDTVADNASAGLYVLGNRPVNISDVDLRLAGMVMERKGEAVSLGVGAACLGHPLNAALWLARTMVKMGTPLRAGEVILTGALGPLVAVSPGDVLEARIQGLGSVRACFDYAG
ncbi:2-oxopent-4-enoate hydratase [Paraburkholderia nemoris]|uniref:2-keto-4-pentenoate hydratase n=1 Tax=Paraburkholderia nemoris TaxID=2793076 RepID=UPI0019149874|nr:fumarylacetoacetate hydrolase family protein [Paraburkholderia nemoris]MBK5151362.1 fumarylacetoacetate hydrolase family protein [Burkholderia sp. R-69608]CAE6952209.1 2-oxopent-4-enoate hydratase [Paraburkholderia nemoris]